MMEPAAPYAEPGPTLSIYIPIKNFPTINNVAVKNAPTRTSFQAISTSGKNLKIEPELTSKTWKKVKLWGWGIIVASFFVGPLLSSNDPSQIGFVIIGIAFWGILILIIGHIGAWYADKRTR